MRNLLPKKLFFCFLVVLFFLAVFGLWFTGPAKTQGVSYDLTNDNKVNVSDLLVLLQNWGSTSLATGDFNNSGRIDVGDLILLLQNWGTAASPSPTATPTSPPTSGLDLYGVKFADTEDYQELASLGVINPVTVVSSTSAIDGVITVARNMRNSGYPNFKPILMPYSGGWPYTCTGITSFGYDFIDYINSHDYWNDILAMAGVHEPMGSLRCASLDQIVAIHDEVRTRSGGRAKIFGKMYSDTSYQAMGFKDGICDYCAVMYHPFRGTYLRDQMVSDFKRDLNSFKSIPPGKTLNKFNPYICTIHWPSGFYMPSPAEMLDAGSFIVNYVDPQRGYKVDGLVWYTWANNSGWIGLDQYNDGQRAGRMQIIKDLSGY